MALLFGSPKKQGNKEEGKLDQRLTLAKDMYMAGNMKIMTTETIPGREILSAFGLIVCRSYNFDNAFYGLKQFGKSAGKSVDGFLQFGPKRFAEIAHFLGEVAHRAAA